MGNAVHFGLLAFLFGFALIGAPSETPGRVVIAGTAAAVGNDLYTVQDAYFFQNIRNLVDGKGFSLQPVAIEDLKRGVNRLLFEQMVMGEMKSLKIDFSLRSKAVGQWNTLKKNTKDWRKLFVTYGKTEADVVDAVWRRLEVEEFLEKKIETFTPIITDTEVERYFEQNNKIKTETLESQRAGIRTLLQKKQVEKSLAQWIRFLQEKYAVVNLLGGGG